MYKENPVDKDKYIVYTSDDDHQITDVLIPDYSIEGDKLANDSVTTRNLVNGSVTPDKIASLPIMASDKVGAAKLGNGLVVVNDTLSTTSVGTIVSIDTYEGETNEDKLYAALDDITSGIILCGNVTITKVYNALAKDYRNITIQGATFNLTIDWWFNNAASTSQSVVQFNTCVFNGNGHVIFPSQYNVIGMYFNGCVLRQVTAFSSTNCYVQSSYFIGCSMFAVENLITATYVYDFKMIGCRVETAYGTLISLSDNYAIRQGVVSNCLIQGRTNVVFSVGGFIGLTIENCYFESLNNGLINQTASAGGCYLTVSECAFFAPMASVDYAIRLSSSSFGNAIIKNNVSNLPSGKYLCNRQFYNGNQLRNFPSNSDYGTSFKNNGFPAYHDRNTPPQYKYRTDAIWDSDNSAWKIQFMLDYEEAYNGLHPIYVVFQGSYGSNTQYAGFAIVRLTPRTAYSEGIITVCDATVVDSCNKTNVIKSSDVGASVSLSSTTATAADIVYTLSITGFNNLRTPRYRIIDPWYFIGCYNIPD